jgi:hypothetical protein
MPTKKRPVPVVVTVNVLSVLVPAEPGTRLEASTAVTPETSITYKFVPAPLVVAAVILAVTVVEPAAHPKATNTWKKPLFCVTDPTCVHVLPLLSATVNVSLEVPRIFATKQMSAFPAPTAPVKVALVLA